MVRTLLECGQWGLDLGHPQFFAVNEWSAYVRQPKRVAPLARRGGQGGVGMQYAIFGPTAGL